MGRSKSPPPVIVQAPGNQQIANRMPPVNFAQIMNEVSGDNLTFVRGTDGKVALRFGNNKGRISLDAPIALGNVNTSLPAVRQVRGRDITQEAAAVIVLMQAMRQLTGTIEKMEQTSPLLIEQNREILDSFKSAQQQAIEKGFDIRQHGIDVKLAKMGLANSSTALGAQIALAREKAEAQVKANLEYTSFAQNLKQQGLENMHKRGEQIAQNANVELGRFATETSNQLQQRGQDMQADLAVQGLEQQRALSESELQLARNEQYMNSEIARRQFQLSQANTMASLGIDLINNTNSQSIAARATDNQRISDMNNAQYQRYSLTAPNPWQQALNVGLGAFAGKMGASMGERIGGSSPNNDGGKK